MRKLIFSFSFLIASYISFSQNWVPVGSGVSNYVNVLDSANGLLYLGGTFDTAGGIVVNHIAAWNGVAYSALGSGVAGGAYLTVNAITEYNGNIIVAGNFTSAGGVPVNNIAMWNGSSWSALGLGVTGTSYPSVSSLAVFNNNLYAAGNFDSAGGAPAKNIAQWNGISWSVVGKGISYNVNGMAVYDSSLYVGGVGSGLFSAELNKWNGTAWDSIKGIYSNQAGCIENSIQTLATGNGLLYMTGVINDSAQDKGDFASWNGTALSWYKGTYQAFISLYVYHGIVIAGNTNIEYYNDTIWKPVGNGISFCDTCNICGGMMAPMVVFTIAGYNGKLYVGGAFTKPYGNQASYLEMFSGIVGINEVKETKTIIVYPNPSNGLFQLKITNYELGMNKGLEVYNMFGERVLSQYPILTSQYPIDLSNQPTGVYLYRVTNTDGGLVSSGKLIKE